MKNNMLYFIVGPTGVGKTFFAEKINELYGIPYYDTGPILRHKYKSLNLSISFGEWIINEEKKHNGLFAMETIASFLKNQINPSIDNIIVGNRCLEGIKIIANKFNNIDYKIIYIDASYNCLIKNYETREHESITYDEYKNIIDGDYDMGLYELREYVKNNGNDYYIYKKNNDDVDINNIFKNIRSEDKRK